jgi:hypothetical protein
VTSARTGQDTPTDDSGKEERITETIEEIAPDDTTATGEPEVIVDEDDEKSCFKCGYKMISLSTCHLKCPNCGTEKDCSEITIW